ncbi:hypothetical protein PBCVKS1B_639R [Paramecium bursaria Chlorella virus KS1B]|uniref:hypothetical protein n=1 Tax=Only Syngen Nebraska virus 5 TaxID=1917232 RepID=UPI0002B25C6D|nr:hypothetical protein BST79_gp338 [Only Syngen Nebraska virus 5]AGE54740.1 hypothetical protein PBCVKS1B_639R [Paramecium bursaria Chlorella virus KS1B]APC25851.1 hypothetical protein [Only Syngen Nebraska virus 5]
MTTSYYHCICGYSTKNEEHKNFHQQSPTCRVYEKKSCFEGRVGIIYKATSKYGKHKSFFGKWFESEEELRKLNSNYDIEAKVVDNCDIAYVKLITKAEQTGLLSSDNNIPMIRNGSADQLFSMAI